jgi:hypothetical protein
LLHSFLTSALDGGKWSTSLSGRFIPGTEPRILISFDWDGGCALQPIWTFELLKKKVEIYYRLNDPPSPDTGV